MKRGFLLKAAKKAAADNRQTSEAKSTKNTPQLPTPNLPLPGIRIRYGNLTEQEKALPEDYDKSNPIILERDQSGTDSIPGGTLFMTMPHIDDGNGSTEWIIKGQNTKAKVFNTLGYPKRIPKPRPDLYEIRMTPDMGQGIFAKRNIKCGELIFSERPLLMAPNWLGGDARMLELYRQYTPDQARQVLMFEFEKVLDIAVQRMGEKEKAAFMSLCNSHTADGSGDLFGIMRTNSFVCDAISDAGPLKYGGICNVGSRINHSCMHNVGTKFKVTSFSYQFLAVRDIKAGEELFCSYCGLTKAERQTELAPYGFSCCCPACINATPTTDNLRKTFKARIARLRARVADPNEDWG